MTVNQGTREYRRLPTATDVSSAYIAPAEQITVKLHSARGCEALEMAHLSALCGMIAMLAVLFIPAPACADLAKFDDISNGNAALSDALPVPPDRVTLLSGANMFATMPGQGRATTEVGTVTLNSLVQIYFTSDAGGLDGESTSVAMPVDNPPGLGSCLELQPVRSGRAPFGMLRTGRGLLALASAPRQVDR